jgi:hypothetical protein
MARVNPISELQRKRQIEETRRRRKRLNEEARRRRIKRLREEIRRIIGKNPGIRLYTAKKKASYNVGNRLYTKRKYNRKPMIICDRCKKYKRLSYKYKSITRVSVEEDSTPYISENGLCKQCHEIEKLRRKDPNFKSRVDRCN